MMRITTIPPPSNHFQRRCIDWGPCGICAMTAKNSILLYSINMTNNHISLLKVVEFSTCNILSLKFHNDEPLLAVSRSSGLLIYDCQKGQTRSGLKIDEFSGLLTQLEWCGDILICLSKSNILYGVQILSIENDQPQFSSSSYRRISFTNTDLPRCKILWGVELKVEINGISIDHFHRCRILAYSNNNSSISLYQSDNPKTAPHFIFSYQFSNPILDAQFHPQIADLVFILTSASTILSFELQTKSVFFVIQEQNAVMKFEQLILPLHTYNNVFVICSDSTIISYETMDKVQFRKKYWSSSLIKSQHFKSTNSGKFISDRCYLLSNPLFEGAFLLYSKPIGLAMVKSSFLLNVKSDAALCSGVNSSSSEFDPPFRCSRNAYEYYVSLNKNAPHPMTCFDCCDGLVGYGSNEGDIYIVDTVRGDILFHFNFGERIAKFLFIDSASFIFLSVRKLSGDSLQSSGAGAAAGSALRDGSDGYEGSGLARMFNAGYFDIAERTLTRFKNVTEIFSNRQFGIVQHGGFYFEIILNGALRKSSPTRIRKMYIQTEISTCALQIENEVAMQTSSSFNDLKAAQESDGIIRERHRAGSTLIRQAPKNMIQASKSLLSSKMIEDDDLEHLSEKDELDDRISKQKVGDKIVFVTSQAQNLVIYDITTDKYVRKLQCPKEFKNAKIIQVSYTQNLIVFTSLDSKICLVNLKQSSSRLLNTQFTGIRKISFQERGTKFAVLSNDNRLAVFELEPSENSNNATYCNQFVIDFAPCWKQMFIVQSVERELKFLSEDLLLQIKQNSSSELSILPTKVQRLNNVISAIEKQNNSTNLSASDYSFIYACNLFQFESLIWMIVDKYFQTIEYNNRKMIQLKYYQYGDDQEYKSLTTFRSSLILNNSNSYDASLFQLLTAIRCNDVVKMREAILMSNDNIFGVIAATLIDAQITDGAASFLEQTAMDYFDKGKNLEATILMELVKNRLGAAAILQSKNMWNASLEILVTMKKTEEAKELIKNAAFHYLEINETKKAILLFLSVGDFYPVLSILKLANMDTLAYFLLKFVENKAEIKMCSQSKRNLFNFEPLDSLKESIIQGFNDFIK